MPTFYINKGESKAVYPTLTEKSLLDPSERAYIWKLQYDLNTPPVYFTATEESTELQRYNKFTVTEKTSPNDRAGEVELLAGQYDYFIYEISNAILPSVVNLSEIDYSLLTLVEQGILQCLEEVTDTEYTGLPTTNTVNPNVG